MTNIKVILRYITNQFYVPREEDEIETYNEIKDGVQFKGYNLWVLGFSMILACIGLTTNSISAVIGAMLISPLMGPVIGLSFGLAINDKELRRKSIRNWIWMTSVSLIAATLYFLINPFDNSTDVLESFKKPTIFDIFLAFFGGLAGFLGIIKKEGTKIIAGVAIATACMPPLCTAAYGIAHLDYKFFIGGFYFYIINSMFIGWASYLLTRYFKFKALKKQKYSKRYNLFWDFLVIIMMLPSLYIAYQKWDAEENKPIQLSTQQKIDLLEKRIEKLGKNR